MKARERNKPEKESVDPGAIPKVWPNGSGYYKQGTAHLKDESGLIGRIIRGESGKAKAWKKVAEGKYHYLGLFASPMTAMQRLSNRS